MVILGSESHGTNDFILLSGGSGSLQKPSFEGEREREREIRERMKVGEVVRDITLGGRQETVSPVLKVPRQCSLAFLVR
jgi:hypothetical protein